MKHFTTLCLFLFGLECFAAKADIHQNQCDEHNYQKYVINYDEVEDPDLFPWWHWKKFVWVKTFAFQTRAFKLLWPDYGHHYDDVKELCQDERYMKYLLGKTAISRKRTNTNTFAALPVGSCTQNHQIVRQFLNSPISHLEGIGNHRYPSINDSRMQGLCEILSLLDPNEHDNEDIVIITEYPLYISQKNHSYRLRPDPLSLR